ncbi:MAG: trypsin-like peptidase domain-containing protein [Anaerolineales bacterium]|nr:trypsin-like peptidase domain-containing protein [Anaerolineales bacterium]
MTEPAAPPPAPRPALGLALRSLGLFGAGVGAALAALLLYRLLFPAPTPLSEQDIAQSVAAVMASATPPPAFSADVYALIRPALVLIESQGPGGWADGRLGSGVIVDNNGSILTSLHVVTNSVAITVTFADGTASAGRLAVAQPENDIAVLVTQRLPAQWAPAVLGNPGALHIGDEAYAVGNPFGLYGSISAGVISGLDRSFTSEASGTHLSGLIQIDAAVNPGNSGGPLVNRQGQVIGIIAALVNPTEQDVFIGIGFAVPINIAGPAAGMPQY